MPVTRRTFTQLMGGLGAGAVLSRTLAAQSDEPAPNVLAGVWLEPFVDALPRLPRLTAYDPQAETKHLQVTLSEIHQQLHRDLPPALVWAYAGSMPGPTIVARRDRPVTIDWINKLPEHHRLAIDHTLCGAGKNVPAVRTVVHLHGGHVAASSDGYPEDWVTPSQTQHTIYPNRQPGATLWYHDHAMGITRLNAMMGLAGLYILEDPAERALGLPSGAYDVPLILQDRTIDAQGQIIYPVSEDPHAPSIPEFFGTHILVNGRVSPYLDVEPRLYRFRMLNGSNTRVFQLSLLPGQEFFQIASDGGLLGETVARREMLLAPGERIEAIVDFRGRAGRRITLVNDAPAPYPSGGAPVPRLAMQFRVSHGLRRPVETSRIPQKLPGLAVLEESAAVKTRRLVLEEVMAAPGRPHRVLLNGAMFLDPITEDPKKGSIEIWELVNATKDAHPIHLHAIHFRLLDRRFFDVRRQAQTAEVVFRQRAIPAAPEESGWKDTVLCPPGQVTRILAPFDGEPGRYVWHCHTLEHEDNEMMRPYTLRA